MWTPELIEDLLKSKEFKAFMVKKIHDTVGTHDRVKTPRIEFSKKKRDEYYYRGSDSFRPKRQANFITEEEFSIFKQDSVLAGGAIAAWVSEYLFFTPPVINDVDLFTYKFESHSKNGASEEVYSNLETEDYGFQIVKNQNFGILNQVDILPDFEFSWNQLLKSFDLNCSEVGWNLNNGSLFYTSRFMDYLLTREIKINFQDEDFILTSLVRAARKKEELQAKYFQDDELRKYLLEKFYDLWTETPKKMTISLVKNKHEAGDVDNDYISAKRLKVWREYPRLLEPYLKVSPTKRHYTIGDVKAQPWFSFMHKLAKIQEKQYRNYEFKSIADYFIRTFHKPKMNLFTENAATLERIIFLLSNSNIFENYLSWTNVFEARPEFFKKSFNEERFKKTADFLHSHARLKSLNLRMVTKAQWEVTDLINWYSLLSKQPLYIIGLLESLDNKIIHYFDNSESSRVNQFGEYIPDDYLIDAELTSLIQAIHKKNFPLMIKLLSEIREKTKDLSLLTKPLKITPFDNYVIELVETSSLEAEGSFMHHCVGGYSQAIKLGKSRIFSIRTGIKERSTLEIRFMKESSAYIIVQHKTFNNNFPIPKHFKIAELFLSYLNHYMIFIPTLRSLERKNTPQTRPIPKKKIA